jgi:formylglycine-generating enzyme required for sulfatase activity
VGQFKPSAEGLYDLAGNVWEWTQERELRGRGEGTLRGGSWAYFKRECLTSGYLYVVPAKLRAQTFGFRCVLDDRKRTQGIRLAAASREESAVKAMDDELRKRLIQRESELKRVSKVEPTDPSGDTGSAKPWELGKDYTNSLGLKFPASAAEGAVVFCATETTLAALKNWCTHAGTQVPKQPHFVTEPLHPAVNVSWVEAVAFCRWLTESEHARGLIPVSAAYRLPSDAEWSRAAGLKIEVGADPQAKHVAAAKHYIGGKYPPKPYSLNIQASQVSAGYDDDFPYVGPVASMVPDAGPLCDLGGNVSEWCQDSWPGIDSEVVVRGASWLSAEESVMRTSHRMHRPRASRRYDIGFRIVLDLTH